MKTSHIIIASAALFVVGVQLSAQTVPFERDGEPDPKYEVPEELNLNYALSFALDNNHAIRQARERIRERAGIVLEVRSLQIPNVTMGGSVSGNSTDISNSILAQRRDWGISVQATQALYAGGGIQASGRSASLAREAAELELRGVINEQLLAVRSMFYGVLLAKQLVTVQEENIKLLEEQLKDAQNRFEAGSISNFEVLRARVALANGQPDLITARNNYRLAIEEVRQVLGFSNVTGNNLAKLPVFVGSLKVDKHEDVDLRNALNSAHSNRPELQRLAKLEAAGEEQIVVSRSGALPQISAFGRYDWVRGGPSSGWNDKRDGWTAGLQAQWSVFDGRASQGKVAQAKSRLMQTKLAVEESVLAVDVEVRRSHSSLTEAWELVSASGKVVEQADEALRLAKVRYSAGTATQLDVLTSQVELTRARLNQLQAYYRYQVAVAALRKAMGEADPYINN
jgi:outer membrane protein|uniref:TolC family protein n=2 Tax=Cephaloticoccus sp. TaxID=1985742 RepID=UPI0040491DA0